MDNVQQNTHYLFNKTHNSSEKMSATQTHEFCNDKMVYSLGILLCTIF